MEGEALSDTCSETIEENHNTMKKRRKHGHMSEPEMKHYKKTQGAANMAGEWNEVKTAALLFFRELNKADTFSIATNMKAGGFFDDLVLTLLNRTIFLQLKHREAVKKIQATHLNQDKGHFSLKKYYDSYCEVKNCWTDDDDLKNCGRFEDAIFIVCTNMGITEGLGMEGNSDWQNIISTGGRCIYFTEETSPLNGTNLPFYNDFLSQFRFFVEQAGEKELDVLIKQELRILCGTETMYQHFLSGIENWWSKKNYFLTNETQFWQDIVDTTKRLNLIFNEHQVAEVAQMLTPTLQVLHFINTQTNTSTNLSYMKIQQSLKNKLMVSNTTLQAHLSEVLSLWAAHSCYNVLVVEGDTNCQNVIAKIADVLSSNPEKQLIIVACESDVMARDLCQEFPHKQYTDRFSLSQLDATSYDTIMNCAINFQGVNIALRSIASAEFLQSVVSGDDVVDLLTGNMKIGSKLFEQAECYIPRTLLRSEHIDNEIFTAKGNGVLAVSGISAQELAQLVPSGETIAIGEESTDNGSRACRYFVIDNVASFNKLCDKHNQVHWLEKKEDSFTCKMSKGDPELVRSYAIDETYSNLKDIVSLPEQIVLFVAEPGMGKSTELSHLGFVLKEMDLTTWVIKVDLNSHAEDFSCDQVNALDLLFKAGHFVNKFQKSLLRHKLHSEGNVVVMFDGFDEVSPLYTEKVLSMLKELRETKIKKICVTSRPVMRKRLEQDLLSLHFRLTHFSPENQEEFLLKFWNLPDSEHDMKMFINELLKLTKSSLNDKMSTFTGIPLQTRMLAEAFQKEAKHYNETGEINLPHGLDLLQLYKSFVDRKWEIYCIEKNKEDMKTVGSSEAYTDLRDMCEQHHMSCAVVSLLDPEELKQLHNSKNIMKKCKSFLDKFKIGREKTGIVVDVIDGRAEFIHRTFAEYFVAMWFCQNFEFHREYIQRKFFDNNFQIVRDFFNRMLAQNFELHNAVLNLDKDKVQALLSKKPLDVNMKDEGDRTPLNLAVILYVNKLDKNSRNIIQEIIEILLKHGADPNIEDEVFQWTPLRISERIGAWTIVNLLLENNANGDDLVMTKENINDTPFVQNVLREASRLGLVNLVAFMLDSEISVDYQIDVTNATMLHVAAEHRQLQLVQFLAEQNANIEAQNSQYKKSPLMWAADKGNLQVVKCLLELGAKPNAKDWLGNTALLRAAQRGQFEVFKLLSEYEEDMTVFDKDGNNVLHHAAVSRNIKLTSYILDELKLDINCCNKEHQTPIWRTVWYGLPEITSLLCEHGADLQLVDSEYGWTPLHVAVLKSNLDIIKCLVKHGSSVTSKDKEGFTPVDLANRKDRLDVVELLRPTDNDNVNANAT